MINELYALADAIENAGISPYEWHKDLKELPNVSEKKPLYRIWFSADHTIYRIDTITAQTRAGGLEKQVCADDLRKWEKNNGCAFPAFNLPNLYNFKGDYWKDRITEKDEWINGKKDIDFTKLKKWLAEAVDAWEILNRRGEPQKIKVNNCLHKAPKDLLETINGFIDSQNALTDLIRFLEGLSADAFRSALEKYIFSKLKKHEDVKPLLNFLFSDSQLSVILDLENYSSSCPVAHQTTIKWLNEALIRSNSGRTEHSENKKDRNDAFGSAYTEVGQTMPEVKLPGLGGVKLRSMFAAHDCQKRYGLIEDNSYPITIDNRAKIKKSLEWLAEDERQGKTWGIVEAKEILFVYPSSIPPVMPRFTALLGAAGNASPEKFASRVEDVLQTIRGLPQEKQPKNIHIFAIHKMDKARSKVVFYRTYSMQNLNKSAGIWQAGCANVPALDIWVWSEQDKKKGTRLDEKQKPELLQNEALEPLQTAKIINKIWRTDGISMGEAPRTKHYQGIELFFSDLPAGGIRHLLNVLLTNCAGLIIYLGNRTHEGGVLKDKEKEGCAALFPLLGLLLYKQGCYKEEYMENMPYQIGQLLKVADELHALYCKVVRDGNIPPQLAGNSLFVATTETPVRALAQLSTRLSPYLAWAKQYRTKDIKEKEKESWRAAWYIRLFESIATKLDPNINNSVEPMLRFNDLEKAQLFIGYLAEFPRREKADEDSQGTTSEKQKK
ncbi:MAG: hypothetical protein LBD78_11230 [Spirochaetaceae bacterium]|jgi:hypothetical protein|nr:hypothetical protein [Spirochaetaceae bacterium]